MLLVCFLEVRPGPGRLHGRRFAAGACRGWLRRKSADRSRAERPLRERRRRTADAARLMNCRRAVSAAIHQPRERRWRAIHGWRRGVNRGFRRRERELPVWPRESGLPKRGSSPRVFKETWDAWRRGCAAGAAPEGGSRSNEGENMSRRSAGRLRGFGTLRRGTREVSVPAVSMARRRVDRLRAANIAAAPWKFARKLARPPSCVRIAWIQSESFRTYCFLVRAGRGTDGGLGNSRCSCSLRACTRLNRVAQTRRQLRAGSACRSGCLNCILQFKFARKLARPPDCGRGRRMRLGELSSLLIFWFGRAGDTDGGDSNVERAELRRALPAPA